MKERTEEPPVILHISFDGILEPLGASQVVRPIEGLVARGYRYVILSFEKPRDLACGLRLAAMRKRLAAAGVPWCVLPFRSGGGGPAASNMYRALRSARRICRSMPIRGIHARSYLSAAVALSLWKVQRIPYLFDTRGYWVDERREAGHWFTNELAYRTGLAFERELYKECSGVVGLTQLCVEDVVGGRFCRWPRSRPAVAIPTCTDYGAFHGRGGASGQVPPEVMTRVAGKLVFGYVGSVNPSYDTSAALRMFRLIREQRSDVHLLVLSRQGEVLRGLCRDHGLSVDDFTVAEVPHAEVPAWLQLMDWGFLLIRETPAKRASMPTKLAEFFAAGVRPIHYGCNEEVLGWVRRAGSGVSLRSLDEQSLREASEVIVSHDGDKRSLARARNITRGHFDLPSGVERYAHILDKIVRA